MRNPTPSRPATSVVRVGTALAIPELLRGMGFDPEAVLAEVGCDIRIFANAENRISLAVHNHIVEHCALRTGCAHFGLLVGQQDALHSFGLVGLFVRYSRDVREALNNFIRFLHLHVQGAHVGLAVDDHSAMLTWQITDAGIEAIDHVSDGAVAVLHNIMRDLCGPDWRPTEAWFAHRMPADVGPFRRFFRVPLRFDAEQYALIFPVGFLNHRLGAIDGELRLLVRAQVEMLEQRHGNDFPSQVRSVLGAALLAGECKAEHVAALFGIHSRTLNRRLSAFDVSFQQLVDESRYGIARQMLEYTATEIGQISDVLGYAAPGVFTRAFRRWSGTTPVEWRAAHIRKDVGLAAAPSMPKPAVVQVGAPAFRTVAQSEWDDDDRGR